MRTKKCHRCDEPFSPEGRNWQAHLCLACAQAARKENYIKSRRCIVCGATFIGTPRSKYCSTCRRDVQREQKSRNKRRGSARALGSTDICLRCGNQYTVTGSQQKWCRTCSETARAEAQKAYAQRYRDTHREQIAAHARACRANSKVCVVCGAVFDGRGPAVTCSEECAHAQLLRRKRASRAARKAAAKED